LAHDTFQPKSPEVWLGTQNFSLHPPFSFWPTNLFRNSSSLFVPPQLPLGPISRGLFGPLQFLRPGQSSSHLSPVHQPVVALRQPAPGPSEPHHPPCPWRTRQGVHIAVGHRLGVRVRYVCPSRAP
jgi:hypothetical protein